MSDLAAAEERWRSTIDHAPVGIALVALDGQFVRVNQALCRTLGYPRDQLITRTFQELTHPDDLERDLELRDALLAGDIEQYQMRKRYRTLDGSLVWAELFVSLARDDHGEPLHYISYIQDISEQVEAAERLERSNGDLEAFAALASHDLQAPLGTVRGYLELLVAEYGESVGEQGRAWLAKATGATGRMSSLLTSLLEFSRAAGSGAPVLGDVAFRNLVHGVVADLAELLQRTGTTVRVVGEDTVVEADGIRLRQVLQNLIENAVKYHHPDRAPVIELTVEEGSDAWQVSVADNGVGVPEADRDRVFTMFHQAQDGAAPDRNGYGVGLAVTRRIVERHGGRIWIEDNPGGGSRFCFTLPRPEPRPE